MDTKKVFLLPGLAFLGAAMAAAPTRASDAKGGFALHGIGAQPCQLMLQEMRTPPPAPVAAASVSAASAPAAPASAVVPTTRDATIGAPGASAAPATSAVAGGSAVAPTPPSMRPILTSWILGYLTASDRLVKDTFDATPLMAPEALTSMIIGVCQKYPDARVETVMNTVLAQLATARITRDSPIVEVRVGNTAVPVRKSTLVAMQEALVKKKLMKEPADGTFGSTTEGALRSFQKSQNLPDTGLPDPATVVRLLVEMPSAVVAK